MDELKAIALELLEKWEEDEGRLIDEYSCAIKDAYEKLAREVEDYKRRIEGASK